MIIFQIIYSNKSIKWTGDIGALIQRTPYLYVNIFHNEQLIQTIGSHPTFNFYCRKRECLNLVQYAQFCGQHDPSRKVGQMWIEVNLKLSTLGVLEVKDFCSK